ncbi:hypothetical protein DBR32_08870 [Taibaiella sp. KBW10]|uniref:hypothetical protein n=1 Tax=Taibaiella sp. KBW10 TaxID=2153357 RepID=UPI000F5B2EB9|nr:hypothetical protein [Taibaiella sp. KBW10]RQO30823.1 hypothetical protein DBR32_08870 [Taibaiella sp. KBW10]
MLERMHQYYIDEKSVFAYALGAGILFLLIGFCLWQKFSINPISKGLGTGLLIAGLLLVVGSFSTRYYNEKKISELSVHKGVNEIQLRQSEIQRMDKVMNQTFKYAFITFTVLIISLVLFIVFSKSYYWKGFSMAMMLLVVLLLISDTYSAQRNAAYQEYLKSTNY